MSTIRVWHQYFCHCHRPFYLHQNRRLPQHDAREPGYFWGRLRWKEIRPDAVLHSSVYKRFAAEKVQHYYEAKAYRPENLSKHGKLQQYYRQGLQGPSASAQGAFAPTI